MMSFEDRLSKELKDDIGKTNGIGLSNGLPMTLLFPMSFIFTEHLLYTVVYCTGNQKWMKPGSYSFKLVDRKKT